MLTLDNNIKNYSEPRFFSTSNEAIQLGKNIFTDFAVGAALTGAAFPFAATPYVGISLVVFSVGVLALNFFSRILSNSFMGEKERRTADVVSAFNMSLLYGTTGNILAHESGHKMATSLVYQCAKPRITIDSLFSGSTTWKAGKFSKLGAFLGPLKSQIFIASAGPIIAVVVVTLGIVAALQLGSENNYFKECALFSGAYSVVAHVNYALSALSADPLDLTHDFTLLWKCGVHPIASAVFLLAIPTFILISFWDFKRAKNLN